MEEFIGAIKLVGFNFAPRGWALCNGQLMPIAQNTALFSLLGTIYGGDGQTTFALPDLRGRVAVGMGSGPGLSPIVQGQSGGVDTTSITVNNLPAHTHAANLKVSSAVATDHQATTNASIGAPGFPDGRNFKVTLGFNNSSPNVELNGDSVNVGATGGSQPFNNMQPYVGLNYIICLQGIFPSRP